MAKSKKAENSKKQTPSRTCLYEILGIDKSASETEIKKAYRVRALQCHPDKNPSEEAKVNFQKLVTAYNILKDPESRKLYDESGFIEGEGFDRAADFFRTKFGRISEQDIFDFEKKYKKSIEEIEDVKTYYLQNNGDISKLLEWIPLSEPDEVERFIAIADNLIRTKELPETAAHKSSIPKLRKNAEKMKKEQAKFNKENDNSMADLALAIQERRMKSSEFFDSLISKYSEPVKRPRNRK